MQAVAATDTELRIAEALRAIPGPVFAASCSGHPEDKRITVHVAPGQNLHALRSAIFKSMRAVTGVAPKIRVYSPALLNSAKSLEVLIRKFDGNKIIYDPTGSIARSVALVAASRMVRSVLKERINGLYYAPLLRTYYVVLERVRFVSNGQVRTSATITESRCV